MKTCFKGFICEGDKCGSPTYAFVTRKFIFESMKFETRVECGGCGHIQSKEYSDDLIIGKIKPSLPIENGWIHPSDSRYDEVLHYSEHEKLIEIVGLVRKEVHYIAPRRYP